MDILLNKWSIKFKIIGNSAVLIVLLVITSLFAVSSMVQIGNELEAIVNEDIPLTEVLSTTTVHQLEQAIHIERALRLGALIESEEKSRNLFDKEVEMFDKLGKKVEQEINDGKQIIEVASGKAHDEDTTNEFKHVVETLNKIKVKHADFEHHAHQVFEFLLKGKMHEADLKIEQVEREEEELTKELEALLFEVEKFTEKAGHKAQSHEQSAIKAQTALFVLALVIAGLLSWMISSNVVRRLNEAANKLGVISEGDLSQVMEVDGEDEISNLQQSMQIMSDRLKDMISRINETSSELNMASNELSTVTRKTSENIHQQQLETEQVATAITEMSAAVQDVAQNVNITSDSASDANAETKNGQSVVKTTISDIQQLASQIDNASDVISQVEKNSEEISIFLDVIKSIAEQTNLLALNAAIEAARAGEQGRGFAVVADEVRTLAGRTQESTSEINQIIDKLQTDSQGAVNVMSQSQEQVKKVVEQAGHADSSLFTVAESVAKINEMSTQIAIAAEQQSAVSEEMNRNVIHINEMAKENSRGAEQTSSAGKNVAKMASELQKLISQFKV